ncbi:MAG: DNA polymerase ligase N-terminal domain-containing protein [Planctomycetota bacterium]|nr:DNA polymerase ligase N-terminal domain-containing protein [Planctomycetota bacterium]
MPRFVILHHKLPPESSRRSHWDLMLEHGDHLATWELPEVLEVGTRLDVVPLANHRLEYLDYEGPLTEQRGTVSRYEWGSYKTVLDDALQQVVVLHGQTLEGRLTIGKANERGRAVPLRLDPA